MDAKPARAISAALYISAAIILLATTFCVRTTSALTGTPTSSNTVETTVSAPAQSTTPTQTSPPSPSLQDIRNELREHFDEVKALFKRDDPTSEVKRSLDNIRDNLISSLIWDYLGYPLVAVLMALMGSFSTVGKIALRFKRNRDAEKGRSPSRSAANVNLILDVALVFAVTYVVIFVLLQLYMAAPGQIAPQIYNTVNLAPIEERLDRIDGQVQALSKAAQSAPTPPIQSFAGDLPASSQIPSFISNFAPIIVSVLF